MRYIDKATELKEIIRHDIDNSNEISLSVVEEWNKLLYEIYDGSKTWYDEYKKSHRIEFSSGGKAKWHE